MPLDGLRAWIGEVERKLGMRTRVFLALAVLAIGGAGAAIFIAANAQDNSVSEGDVRALQEKLEAQITGGSSETNLSQLETEVKALQDQVKALQGGSPGSGTTKGSSNRGSTGPSSGGPAEPTGGGSGGAATGSAGTGTSGQGTATTGSGSTGLQEILRKAKEQQK